jgi:glycosyltransferase involved in cell wall biosynthesis
MATGRAAVVSERRALADYIVPGREALTVPPGDAAALASALRRLLDDRQLARRVGQAGRAAIDSGLTTRHFAAGLVPLLAGEAHRPAAGSGP